jgi:terminase, large subunit
MGVLFKDRKKTKIKKPAWISDDLWETLLKIADENGGVFSHKFSFSRAERKVLKKPKQIKVSKWAEKHRVLTMSALPGPWRNSVTPYIVGIMDALAKPFVRECNICKCPQSAGSEGVHNFIGSRIDMAPGPVLYVFPDEITAEENSRDRVLPMIQSSRRLRPYFIGLEKDKSALRINLQHMPIYFAWARSASRLANKPIRYAVADEIDKPGFDPDQKEASKIDLIRKRLITYKRLEVSKFIKISTPTLDSGNIWIEFNNADIIFDFHVKCPFCQTIQLMDFGGIKWAGRSKADPKVLKNKKSAWYECIHCEGHWDDDVRNMAVQHGLWMDRKKGIELFTYLEKFRPSNISFHIPAWISYFVSLSECAAAFLEGLHDPLKAQDYYNSFAALPYRPKVKTQKEDEILAHKNHLPAGVVPKDAIALTCGIDVQKRGFWFLVKAWTRDLDNHNVQYGYVTTFEDVENLVFNTRYPVEGKSSDFTMGIWRAAMDTGGGDTDDGEWTRTEEIYTWIRKNGRNVVFGVKGNSRPQINRVVPRTIDKMKRGNRPIPGGLVLYFLDVDKFKDLYHWRLFREEGQSQRITLNSDTGVDYARQVLAEEKQKDRRTGKTKWVPVRHDNHLLDCENYAAACADPEWTPSLSFIVSNQDSPGRRIISRGVNG